MGPIEWIALGNGALALGLAVVERIRSRKQAASWQGTATNALAAFTKNGEALFNLAESIKVVNAKIETVDARCVDICRIVEGHRSTLQQITCNTAPKKRAKVVTNG